MTPEQVLRISKDTALPRQFVTHRNALLGMSGAGKSNASAVIAEEMFKAGLPWIAIDPKGDSYGIRSSRDGRKAGLDVPIIGGEHGDLPLGPTQGKRMGELVAEGKLTGIFDLSGFETDNERARFMADFGRALFRGRKTPIHIFCDECHEYMPQPGAGGRLEGPAAECVGVWKRILTQGRQRGIGVTLASQRTAQVNKTCLYQCETLIAMRTMGKLDRKAIEQWVDSVGDARELLEALPRLGDGEAFIWSPMRLKLERRVKFRLRETYDSGRTPEVGEAVVAPKLADLDLAALRAELQEPEPSAPAPEDSSAGSPAAVRLATELRGRVVELERQQGGLSLECGRIRANRDKLHDALERALGELKDVAERATRAASAASAALGKSEEPLPALAPKAGDEAPSTARSQDLHDGRNSPRYMAPSKEREERRAAELAQAGAPPKGELACLIAIAQHHDGVNRQQLTILTGYKRSTRDAYLQRLRAAGSLAFEAGGTIKVTPSGRKRLPDGWQPLPTGRGLREHWLRKLPEGERAVFELLVAAFPGWVSRDKLSEKTGYKRSTRDAYIQRLRGRRLAVDATKGGVRAAEDLF